MYYISSVQKEYIEMALTDRRELLAEWISFSAAVGGGCGETVSCICVLELGVFVLRQVQI